MDDKKFQCNQCGKKFKSKLGCKNHEKRGNCMNLPYICQFCSSRFSKRNSLSHHVNHTCKQGKLQKMQQELDKQKLIIEEKEKEIEKLKGENKSQTNIKTQNNIHIDNMNNIHIHINPSGNESLENVNKIHLLKRIDHYYKRGEKQLIFSNMIKTINFDQKENRNVYLPNIKGEYGLSLENNKWNTRKIDELLNELLMSNIERLEDMINEKKDDLVKIIGEYSYQDLKLNLEKYMDEVSQKNTKEQEICLQKIKEILILNRNLVNTFYQELTGQKIAMPK